MGHTESKDSSCWFILRMLEEHLSTSVESEDQRSEWIL